MLITPDLSEAVEGTSDPIPAGVYNVRIDSAEPKTAKTGTPYLKWKLKIFGADGDLVKYNNWPVFHNTMLSGPGAGMLKAFFKAATKTDLAGAFDITDLYGKELVVTLAQGKQQDGTPSTWPEVKAVKPLN